MAKINLIINYTRTIEYTLDTEVEIPDSVLKGESERLDAIHEYLDEHPELWDGDDTANEDSNEVEIDEVTEN